VYTVTDVDGDPQVKSPLQLTATDCNRLQHAAVHAREKTKHTVKSEAQIYFSGLHTANTREMKKAEKEQGERDTEGEREREAKRTERGRWIGEK